MEPGGPDIVVNAEGRRLLAVEVKASGDLERAARQMTSYMGRLPYPAGMVVVGREMEILVRDFAAGGVAVVGPFPTAGLEGLGTPPAGPDADAVYAARVQRWLVSLRDPRAMEEIPEPLRSALADWVLPALESGEVRAAGPRPAVARVG